MKKSSLSLIVAGVMAMAGAAQAQATFDSPVNQPGEASTMTYGQPNAVTSNSDMPDTGTMGAGPLVVESQTITTYNVPVYSYSLPAPVSSLPHELDRGGASETSATPGRAGEASTMTGGVPNMSTDNLPGHVYGPH
ncbi:hypothetical protein HK414_00350 [Ramlibacter terrae]|uniref:Uncharacterized protein n=1 Tax=Ramlibacter terrae TaxID=2732511 RepID=A0ABX6NZN5_9BURK|nr:hypothetical protein HK414_00350 [Ramlibacter terrae]